MIVGIEVAIELISSVVDLRPGDVIASGTPCGVGPVVPGDKVTIEIDTVGAMTLPVIEAVDYTDFKSAFALVSKTWGRHRIGLRFDHFKNESERDAFDDTDEHGNAITAAYIFLCHLSEKVLKHLH